MTKIELYLEMTVQSRLWTTLFQIISDYFCYAVCLITMIVDDKLVICIDINLELYSSLIDLALLAATPRGIPHYTRIPNPLVGPPV